MNKRINSAVTFASSVEKINIKLVIRFKIRKLLRSYTYPVIDEDLLKLAKMDKNGWLQSQYLVQMYWLKQYAKEKINTVLDSFADTYSEGEIRRCKESAEYKFYAEG